VTVWVPDVGIVPVQPPEPAQDVALVVDQVRTDDCPEVIMSGTALKLMAGSRELAVGYGSTCPSICPNINKGAG